MPSARRTRVLIAVIFLALLGWCFGGVLSGVRVLAYRDAAHFYYPLYHWLAGVWGQGEWPLWNPLENTGMPVACEATAAVFYPGKLVFALPCSFALRFQLYVVLHVALAGAAMYCLGRSWRLQPISCALAATAYAFSGTVLFQYCNVVFLVGAAWLPFSLTAAERMWRRRRPRWAVLFGATLALMTLGGDPQAAYHAALLAVLYALLMALQHRRTRRRTASKVDRRASPAGILGLLAVAAISGTLLAAVQIVPAISWTAASGRPVFEHPRSLYEIPSFLARSDPDATVSRAVAGLVRSESVGLHGRHLYDFSVGPWRWPEALWPNFSGRMFPENHRWLSAAVPAEGRIWSPSLYMGLLPLVLGFCVWRIRNASLRIRWMSWSVLWSLLGSLGAYGIVWLLEQLGHVLGRPPPGSQLQGAVGGVYWMMVVLLPAYAYFRFPAKLLVITTLGLSLLAAVGLDRLLRTTTDANRPPTVALPPSFPKRITRSLWLICGTSGVTVVVTLASRSWWSGWLRQASADEIFGPLDVHGAWLDATAACGQAAILAAMLAVLVSRTSRSRYCGLLLLAITAIDLAVANRCLILSAPASVMSTKSLLADREREGTTPLRYYRNPDRLWVPARWKTERDVGRAATALAWDRATLFPRFGLMEQLSSVRSPGTMVPYEYALWLRATLDRVDGLPSQNVLDATGTAYVLTSRRVTASRADQLRLVDQHGEQNVQVWRNEEGARRTWIVRQIVAIPELSRADARSPTAQHQRTLDVLQPAGRPRNFGPSAVVELPAGGTLPSWRPGPGESTARPGEDRCAISHYGRHGVVVEATLTEPGLLVLNDQFWPWWTARVSVNGQPPRRIPILKTNRVMRGVYLPSGRHTITFAYQPVRQYLALVASAVAWLALAVYLAVDRNRKGKE